MQWRLNFGGISEALRLRIDRPAERHGWRGKVMEHVVADAISACVPAGVLRTLMQPHTESEPVDHAERCRADGLDPTAARRADIAVDFRDLHRLVIDVATTNVVSNSALSKSVLAHMEGIESTKDRTYKEYYREFHPLIISLGGGVTERGWGVIKRICCEAARLSRPRLQWEPYQWAVRMLRHICAGMARVMGWIATRIPADAPDDCTVSVVDTGHGHGLALIRPGGGPRGRWWMCRRRRQPARVRRRRVCVPGRPGRVCAVPAVCAPGCGGCLCDACLSGLCVCAVSCLLRSSSSSCTYICVRIRTGE